MRGNNGTGAKRSWLLGPSINVTPAIVGPAQNYFQTGNVVNHKPFEATYATRRKLTWLGADDGFLHAFDLEDGAEVLGLLPPNLIANQIALYKTFLDPTRGFDGHRTERRVPVRRAHVGGRELPEIRRRVVRLRATRRSDSSPREREATSSPRSTSRTPIRAAR